MIRSNKKVSLYGGEEGRKTGFGPSSLIPLALESVWLTMVGARSPLQRLVDTSRLRVTGTARARIMWKSLFVALF